MHAIDRKLIRDFRRLWAQALAIALVLACGVAILLTSLGMYRALDQTRTAYYERNRFADVFASARRAPLGLLRDLARIDGVQTVEARIAGDVILDVPGLDRAAVGRLLSLPDHGAPLLNVPVLRSGRLPETGFEVAVNQPFALANRLQPGDRIAANLNGRKRMLTITGTLLSPEFIYTLGPGAMMPDNRGFAILWMQRETVAAAFDMAGAFNDLTLTLDRQARLQPVLDAVDDSLAPYGGLGAHGRDRQVSNSFIDAEIQQLRSMALVLPPVFFAISAFLVAMVLGRIVTLERGEIGLLKALGYSDVEVCIHYLMLAGLIAVAGIGIGWATGTWLARGMAELYVAFFDFPFLIFRVPSWVYGLSGGMAVVATTVGAARSALAAARLSPAVAMQPPAPPRFRRTWIDAAMARARPSQPTVMILRSLTRWPLRSAMTALGLALAVAAVMASSFIVDSLDELIDHAFTRSNRQDAVLVFTNPAPLDIIRDVARLPGVLQVEGQQAHAAILRNGQFEKRVPIEARFPGADLGRVIDRSGRVVQTPPGGIVLSETLASQLRLAPGDEVEAEFLTGRRGTYRIRVTGLVTQYFGLGAHVDLAYLDRLFDQATQVTMANVTLDDAALPDLHAALKGIPNLAATNMLTEARRSFQDTISRNITIMTTVYITIAVLITVGVAYNGARIQMSERARELASLRILGFTRGQVSYILVGETMLLALLAQPLGWGIGRLLAWAMTSGFSSDLYRIPLVLTPATHARASLVVLAAALGSVLIVRRRLDNLDLVSAMKTRE
ncbi:MAG: ABC transporter permease [Alphaproteobacteria bacterium HGW-Alphaproteobacteria-6]|nr:MAG: ABC transporter permease [Alphaproteobacteria bacterium HGW-Alphaproteobacteria-6]